LKERLLELETIGIPVQRRGGGQFSDERLSDQSPRAVLCPFESLYTGIQMVKLQPSIKYSVFE
jgi:hypothetical protein